MILVPLAAAGAGAVCLAVAAHAQHGAVAAESAGRPSLDLGAVLQLLRRPGWLVGAILTLAGAGCALFALSRAPLTLVQPIGVLAVPIALLISCRLRRRPASPAELVAVAAAVVGVAGFVACMAHAGAVGPLSGARLWHALPVVGPVVAGLILLGRTGPARVRAVAWTAAGAVLYGLGTALVKVVLLRWRAYGLAVLEQPTGWLAALGAVGLFVAGGWCVQHAYHAGSAHLVLAGLTVIDPLVAVVLGITVLGEAVPGGGRLAAACTAAALATVAVGFLAGREGASDRTAVAPPPAVPRSARALTATVAVGSLVGGEGAPAGTAVSPAPAAARSARALITTSHT